MSHILEGQLSYCTVSSAIAEYLVGNVDQVISFLNINPGEDTSEPRISRLTEFDTLKGQIARLAFLILLIIEKQERMDYEGYREFMQVNYGSSNPRFKPGTGISATTLLLLNSLYEDLKMWSDKRTVGAKEVANAVQTISALRVTAVGYTPIVMLNSVTEIHPCVSHNIWTPRLIKSAVAQSESGYWYDCTDNFIAMTMKNLKRFVVKPYEAYPSDYYLALLKG